MSKYIRITTALVLCVVIAVVTYVSVSVLQRERYDEMLDSQYAAYNNAIEALKQKYENLSTLNQATNILKEAQRLVEQYYVFDVDDEAVKASLAQATYDILIAGTVKNEDIQTYLLNAYFDAIGDPYTLYHPKAEMDELADSSQGRLYGIGIYVYFNPDTGHIYVNRVMPNSPAEKAGILAGDTITHIEDVEVTEETYSQCVALVAGELGTTVKLNIIRNGVEMVINPVRGEVRTKSVYTEYMGDYAWIAIMEFSGHVAEDFIAAINEAEKKGVKGYIFDVRSNPGGDLNIICDVLDRLLPEGPIVNIMDKNQNKVASRSSDAICINKPMTVLANGSTASAGELFTAALRDYNMATIIGETTYGKGTMQTIQPLSDGSGVRITQYFYNPPYGENYHSKGIAPDIEVIESEYYKDRPFLRGNEGDEPLKTAIAELDRINSEK